MIEKMKAALLYGIRDVRIEEMPVKQPAPDQALIKIQACGVCPTDVRSYTGLRKITSFPITMGHEWVGEIIEIGDDFHGFNVGDRVAPEWRAVCGNCYYCKKGMFNFCLDMQREKVRGGFYEYGRSTAQHLRLIPDDMSYEEAVFIEPLACCVNGSNKCRISMGDNVVIIGAGPIGLQHLQLAKNQGARVIVSELLEHRLAKPKEIGADDIIWASEEDAVKRVMELTDGRGADAVMIAAGTIEAEETGIAMAGPGGSVNIFAGTYPPGKITIDPNVIHYKELVLTGTHDYTPHDFTTALRLIQFGIVKVKPITSHVLPLEDLAAGFDTVAERKGLKVVIKMDVE